MGARPSCDRDNAAYRAENSQSYRWAASRHQAIPFDPPSLRQRGTPLPSDPRRQTQATVASTDSRRAGL